jgi:hypothetical protein
MEDILTCTVIAFSVLAGGDLIAGASLVASNQAVSGFLFPYNVVFWSGLVGLWTTPAYGLFRIVSGKVTGFESVMTVVGIVIIAILSIGLCGVWSAQQEALKDITTRSEAERLTQTLGLLREFDFTKKTKK